MHHRHEPLVIFELRSFHKVKDTKQQNYLEAVDHYHIYHVDDLLINSNLVFETIVLDEGAIGSRVVIRLDF